MRPERTSCPSCGSSSFAVFHEQDRIPVNSCMLLPELDAALRYPRGDLRLAFCRECGFIGNAAFEPELTVYSGRYEETQGFSPTFQRFAAGLAQQWIDRYDIHGRDILEIGCGKGEFLQLICDLGGNRGIGVDPSFRDDRLDAAATGGQLRFVKDFYSEAYADLPAEVVVCRHTLEHIAGVGDFTAQVRRAIGDRDSLVLFELPDARRVFDDVAFEDIYYEHCSYFTAGSLTRLFRAAGFDILDVSLAYSGQYLLLEARPGTGRSSGSPLEDDLEEMTVAVDSFPQRFEQKMEDLRSQVTAAAGGRAIVWGAGSKGVSFLTTLGLTDEIAYAVDVNPFKQGMFMPTTGHRIVAPTHCKEEPPTTVFVMNAIYCDEVRRELEGLAIEAEIIGL